MHVLLMCKPNTDISKVEMEWRECISPKCNLSFKVSKKSDQRTCCMYHNDKRRPWLFNQHIFTKNYERKV